MNLTNKERDLLIILHEARLIRGKFLKDYEERVRRHFSFSYEELNRAIKKFLKEGLLEETKINSNEVMYFHTQGVSKDMIDPDLLKIGN